MKQNFLKQYEIIWNNFIPPSGERKSLPALAAFLGHDHKGKVTAWGKGQWPSAYDCWVIHQKMGFSLEWLLTGEGDIFAATSSTPASEKEATVLRELTEAKAEIARLQKKMEMLLTRTVELQDELLTVHRAEKAKREKKAEQPSAEESVECAAHTGHTAARS